jgi:hypothetical protein
MNYIILGNVEIFPKRLFSIKKEKNRKDLMECRGYIYIYIYRLSKHKPEIYLIIG